ncbi:hypothetical protein [Methanocaldococcus jannaschii]|uniref:hypothetical protein n=1 Tax=Methanocaldococcus jannaschii TaxID=2190 RepID=UPI0007DBF622|nr:hypothetical protein [Methanocaldococcus jannaschii]
MSISSYINEDINKIDEIYKLHREIEKIFYEEFQRYLARKIFEDVFIVFAKVIKIKNKNLNAPTWGRSYISYIFQNVLQKL